MKLKSLILSIVTVLSLSIPVNAFAQDVSNVDEKDQRIPIHTTKSLNGDSNKITITDPAEIKKIALKENLEYNGKLPKRIEYEYIPNPNTEITQEIPESPSALGAILWYDIMNIKDFGSGFYNASSDLYREFYIDGPDTFVIDKTEQKSNSVTGTFGASASLLSSSLGFNISSTESIRYQSNTPIAAGEHMHIQIYTTYHKKSYQVYGMDNSVGGMVYLGEGFGYKADGAYIKKTLY
ncbi:hypothetical protein BVG16_15595 [Paenibacillus selenitireducens]|uniref:Uncharacterized protein n=1 Tax=Paenibacillus selenitireducens TaxID=1324314 RepID=A0A1T2XA86_9BACL|nr:hypothetical protein [Paenibacillus selenitireducens]OPA76606.1 hypothetical protein BVG16_15595 [Paenibacillus selenitireducens]